jgi:hypothetical protein
VNVDAIEDDKKFMLHAKRTLTMTDTHTSDALTSSSQEEVKPEFMSNNLNNTKQARKRKNNLQDNTSQRSVRVCIEQNNISQEHVVQVPNVATVDTQVLLSKRGRQPNKRYLQNEPT